MVESLPPHPGPLHRVRRSGRQIGFIATVAALALLAIALRVRALDAESLWFDEGWTWWLTSLPANRMMPIIRNDVVAPLYFYVLHVWTRLVGDSVAAMRMLSALLAIATLVPFWFIARRAIDSRVTVLIACAFIAANAMQIQFARDARPYALLSLLTVTALACAIRCAERRSIAAQIGFTLCVTAGLYTHNMMAFNAVALAGAWMIWPGTRPTRARMLELAIAAASTALLYAPWLPTLRTQARWVATSFWAGRPDAMSLGTAVGTLAGVDVWSASPLAWELLGHNLTATWATITVSACVVISLVLTLATRDAARRRIACALIVFAFGPMLGVFAYSQVGKPLFVARVFVAASAIVPILIALPLDAARHWSVRAIGGLSATTLAVLGIATTFVLLDRPAKEDWRGAYGFVARLPPSPTRLIVFVANEGELPFAHYATHDVSRTPEARTGTPAGFFDLDPPRTIRRVLSDADLEPLWRQLASGRWDEVVLVLGHDDFSDPDGRTERELRGRWIVVDEAKLRYVRVVRFISPRSLNFTEKERATGS